MIPMFFGETGRPLFGVFHPPVGASGARGVLISGPIGHEYDRVHRMTRHLAVRLSREGFPTLRFDYTGSGDSSGEAEDGDFEVWQRDLVTAAEELRDTSGCRSIAVVGIRLGGSVAALVPEYPCPVDTIYLWDPVLSGSAYLENLTNQHESWLGVAVENGTPRQLLGTALSPTLVGELSDFLLVESAVTDVAPLVLALSKASTRAEPLFSGFEHLPAVKETFVAEDDYDWHDPQAVETMITAPNMSRELLRRIGNE